MNIKEIRQKHFHQASIGEGSKVSDSDITWLINQNDALAKALSAVVGNWGQINDEHFSGPSEKLYRICKDLITGYPPVGEK